MEPTTSKTPSDPVQAAMLKFEIKRRLNTLQSVESIQSWLVSQGHSDNEAWALIDQAQKTRFTPVSDPDAPPPKVNPRVSRWFLIAGLIWFVPGAGASLVGWMFTEPGRDFYVWHGAMLIGLALLVAAWLARPKASR